MLQRNTLNQALATQKILVSCKNTVLLLVFLWDLMLIKKKTSMEDYQTYPLNIKESALKFTSETS